MIDHDVRDALERLADQQPLPRFDIEPLMRRGYRRAAVTALGGVLAVALSLAVVVGGTALFRSAPPARPVPADRSTITPQPIPRALHNGPISVMGYTRGIIELKLDGATERLVGCGGSCTETAVASWSSDGTRIAYAAQCGGGCGSAGDPSHGIRVLDVRTGEDRLILPAEGIASLDWSPDGTRIAFSAVTRYEDGRASPDGGLYVMNSDGTDRRRIPGAENVASVSWSPDGTTLLYGGADGMVAARLDGSHAISLGSGLSPQWSPDGSRIAYLEGGACSLWTMSPDGGARTRVAVLPTASGGCNGAWPDISFAWSPDGTELATLLRWSVWIVGADGSDPHPLSLDGFERRWGHPFAITWRPVR